MKKYLIPIFALFYLISTPQIVFAHGMKWSGSGGWGPGSNYVRMYDPKTVTTISGEVTAVEYFNPGKGMRHGIHIKVKSGNEEYYVHLGPSWFLENQDLKIAEKDMVEIKGSKITFNGKPAVIAAVVKKGDETLVLRDENGIPAWAGWMSR
jgi:hypothetical protein